LIIASTIAVVANLEERFSPIPIVYSGDESVANKTGKVVCQTKQYRPFARLNYSSNFVIK
jgi:hypothetical protein